MAFTFECFYHLNELLTFLTNFVLTCPPAHPKIFHIRQGEAPHLFPWIPIGPQNAWVIVVQWLAKSATKEWTDKTDYHSFTIVSGVFINNSHWFSFSKLLSIVEERLFHCLVSCQDHHFFGSHIDCEYWPIFLGKLTEGVAVLNINIHKRKLITFSFILEQTQILNYAHHLQCIVRSLEVQLEQVSNQRKWSGSWRFPLISLEAEAVRDDERGEQQDHQGCQRGERAGGLKNKIQNPHGKLWIWCSYCNNFSEFSEQFLLRDMFKDCQLKGKDKCGHQHPFFSSGQCSCGHSFLTEDLGFFFLKVPFWWKSHFDIGNVSLIAWVLSRGGTKVKVGAELQL